MWIYCLQVFRSDVRAINGPKESLVWSISKRGNNSCLGKTIKAVSRCILFLKMFCQHVLQVGTFSCKKYYLLCLVAFILFSPNWPIPFFFFFLTIETSSIHRFHGPCLAGSPFLLFLFYVFHRTVLLLVSGF